MPTGEDGIRFQQDLSPQPRIFVQGHVLCKQLWQPELLIRGNAARSFPLLLKVEFGLRRPVFGFSFAAYFYSDLRHLFLEVSVFYF